MSLGRRMLYWTLRKLPRCLVTSREEIAQTNEASEIPTLLKGLYWQERHTAPRRWSTMYKKQGTRGAEDPNVQLLPGEDFRAATDFRMFQSLLPRQVMQLTSSPEPSLIRRGVAGRKPLKLI